MSYNSPLTSEGTRQRMIARLQERGISHPEVCQAMLKIPRHLFLEPAFESRAYGDDALPLGFGQTISQPFTVARMSEQLIVSSPQNPNFTREKVLEIGTGCGYQTAILAQLFQDVYTVERIGALHEKARATLRSLKIQNVRLVHADGQMGLPAGAPYDAIIMTAAAPHIPAALLEQLRPHGRLILPISQGEQQHLWRIEKHGNEVTHTQLDPVRFVPLLSGRQ